MRVSRQREILPLQPFESFVFERRSISRCYARSLTRKNKTLAWASAGTGSLNKIGGDGSPAPHPSTKLCAGASVAQSHTLGRYSEMGRPPEPLEPEGALHELLAKSSYYDSVLTDIQPYSKQLVSWPDAGSVPTSLVDNVHPADRNMLMDWKSLVLRDTTDYLEHLRTSQIFEPYIDPTLMSSPGVYASFLTRLRSADMGTCP